MTMHVFFDWVDDNAFVFDSLPAINTPCPDGSFVISLINEELKSKFRVTKRAVLEQLSKAKETLD